MLHVFAQVLNYFLSVFGYAQLSNFRGADKPEIYFEEHKVVAKDL